MGKVRIGLIESGFAFNSNLLQNTTNMTNHQETKHGDVAVMVMDEGIPTAKKLYENTDVEIYALPLGPIALSEAVKLDLDIVNLSRTDSTRIAGNETIEKHWKSYSEEHDIFLVASAGNDGENEEEFSASKDHWLAVGALGLDGKRTSYSSYGLGAVFCMMQGDWDFDGDGDLDARGTSFSAPDLCIMLAPYIAWFKDTHGRKSTKEETKQYIKRNCHDLEIEGKDIYTGYGVFEPQPLVLEEFDPFRDDNGKWYEDTVNYLAKHNLIDGYPDKTIRGYEIPTRAEVFQLIRNVHEDLKNRE